MSADGRACTNVTGSFCDPIQEISRLLKRRLEFQCLPQGRLSLLGAPGAQQRRGKISAHQNQRGTNSKSLVPKTDGLVEVATLHLVCPQRRSYGRLSRVNSPGCLIQRKCVRIVLAVAVELGQPSECHGVATAARDSLLHQMERALTVCGDLLAQTHHGISQSQVTRA